MGVCYPANIPRKQNNFKKTVIGLPFNDLPLVSFLGQESPSSPTPLIHKVYWAHNTRNISFKAWFFHCGNQGLWPLLKCKYFWKTIHIFSKIQCWRECCARDDLRGCYWEGRSRRQSDRKQMVLERAMPPCKYSSQSGCCVSFHSPGLGQFLKRVFLSIPFPLSSSKIVSFNLFIVFFSCCCLSLLLI